MLLYMPSKTCLHRTAWWEDTLVSGDISSEWCVIFPMDVKEPLTNMSCRVWIYWMCYNHLSAHSLLAKLDRWGWFIERFTITFLHTHHSLLVKLGRWGWLMRMRLAWKKSQKTLDTSTRLHQNKTRNTGSAGKGLDSQYWELQTRKWAGSSLPGRGWNPYPGAPPTTGLLVVWRPQSKDSVLFEDHL